MSLRVLHLEEEITKLKVKLEESYRREVELEEENRNLRRKTFRHFNNEECWIWNNEGENYLDSLVCPIVISVPDFRSYIAKCLQGGLI